VSAETVMVAIRFWEAARGPAETWDVLHDDIEVHDFDLPDAGVYRGHEGFARWLADWEEPWEEYGGDVHDLFDLDHQVASLMHLHARTGSGLEVNREDSQLLTVKNGRIVKLEWFGEARTALERAADPDRAAMRKRVHDKIRSTYAPPLTVERLVDAGTSVVALLAFRGPDRHCAELWETSGEETLSARTYASHEQALEDAGLHLST
jgi:ketosteroid isomerase-like protein